MNKPEYKFSLLTLALISALLSACQANKPAAPAAAANLSGLVSQPLAWTGMKVAQVNNLWLSVDEEQGLRLLNAAGQLLDQQNIAAEILDQRTDAEGGIFVSVDQRSNRPFSFRVRDQRISDLNFAAPLAQPVEGLCLYQADGQPLQLFVLDEQQTAHQWVINPANGRLNEQTLRQFPLPPAAEFCVVDDHTDRLFITEETMGLWQYNARAESELIRTPVDLVQPWGNLQHGAGPVTIAGDDLWLAEKDHSQLHRYSLSGATAQHFKLGDDIALDALSAVIQGDNLQLVMRDDNSGQLLQTRVEARPTSVQQQRIPYVAVHTQTDPVNTSGDAADDPAIWIHPQQPERSLVLGTNKKAGLHIYDLQGHEQQFLAAGRVNNVDVRQGFTQHGKPMDIAAASQRDRQSIALFSIHPQTGEVQSAGDIPTTLDDVYGFCLYKNPQGAVYAFINDEDGRFEQYEITDRANEGWSGKKVREFRVNSQPEGCAADDLRQRLFVGEEDVAIWTIGAEADAGTALTQVAAVSDILVDDIEGMDIYQNGDNSLLIVSSQGNDSYVVFSALPPYDYIGRFRAGLNIGKSIDGASETDGLTVTSADLGGDFSHGLLVVQDGRNQLPAANQNYKYLSMRDVLKQLQAD